MKSAMYLMMIGLLTIGLKASSQTSSEKLLKKIVIRQNSIRIDSLLNIFSKQTGIEFSFNSKKITPSKIILVKPATKSLKDWLEQLKQKIGVNYSVLGNHIILTDYRHAHKQTPVVIGRGQDSNRLSDLLIITKEKSNKTEIKSLEAYDLNIKTVYQPPVVDVSNKPSYDSVELLLSTGDKESVGKKVSEKIYGVSMNNPRDTIYFISVDSVSRQQKKIEKSRQAIEDGEKLRPLTKLDIGLQGVGFTFERRISSKTTIDFSVGAGGGYNIIRNGLGLWWHVHEPSLYVSITPKFYYNRIQRTAKGKGLTFNSGNYIGLRVKYTSRSISESSYVRDALLGNIHWGMQRAISRKWTINFHVGIGYVTDATDLQNTEGNLYSAIDFKFSKVLGRGL